MPPDRRDVWEIPDWTHRGGQDGARRLRLRADQLRAADRARADAVLALAFAPWVDENIVVSFNPPTFLIYPSTASSASVGGGHRLVHGIDATPL